MKINRCHVVNDCAGLSTGDGLCREEAGVCRRLPLRKLSLSYSLISFPGVDKNAYDNKKRSQKAERYFNRNREFFKEITCQPNGKNSFAQVSYDFGNKFPAGIINDRFYQLDDNMSEKQCQGGFWGNRVYSGGADMNWWFDRLTTLPWFDFRSPSRAKSEGEPTLSGLFL